MDCSATLNPLAKVIVVVIMFVGRLGPSSLMDFLARLPPPPPVRYASEELIVG